jgi:ABC-2 type transport system permease protein
VKFREVFRYDIAYHLRNPVTWAYAAIPFGLTLLVTGADASAAQAIKQNAPEAIAEMMIMLGLIGMGISAGLFGDAAVRDAQAGMDALLYTTALRKIDYLGGRFVAALTVNAIILLVIPLGAIAGTFAPWAEPGAFLPFRAAAYVQPYLLFVVPNLIFTSTLMFTIGVLTRHVIPVYIAAIVIFIVFSVASAGLEEINNPMLTMLADPLGFGTWDQAIQYWTVAERNTLLLGFPPGIVLNRILWIGISALVFAGLHRRFRFTHHGESSRSRRSREPVEDVESTHVQPVEVPRVAGSFGARTNLRQIFAIVRNSLTEVVFSRTFLALLVGAVGVSLLMTTGGNQSTWPLTILTIEKISGGLVTPISYVVLSLYAGELVWQDREVRVADIADATAVPEAVALFGRFLALIVVVAMCEGAMMLGAIVYQAIYGFYDFEIGLYVRILHGLNLLDFALLAALAMTIHVIINHKYLAHIIVVLACASPVALRQFNLVRHNLLLYSGDPGWTYSDMNGFGPFIGPFMWFQLYWAAWALLIAIVGTVLWLRGSETGMRRRLLLARERFRGSVARAASVAVVLIVALGVFIFYNTNILNDYVSGDEAGAKQAEYEKRYARYENIAQPSIATAQLRIEIYPDNQAVDLGGSYQLVNRSDVAIDSIHVVLSPQVEARSLSFDRASTAVLLDDELSYRIYAIQPALEPGDSVQLEFDVAFRARGFPNSGVPTDVVGNGAYFNRMWLPFIGYQGMFELTDGEARERFGLAPQPPMPGPDDVDVRAVPVDEENVRIAAIIGTTADQIAITPGVLRRSWMENGRRYFHYETESPTEFSATVFSGKWAVREDRWRNLPLRIFYHPTHAYNIDRVMESMKASLEYYTTNFGPYLDSHLRTIEIPRYGRFGRAHHNTTAFTEDGFLLLDKEGEMDMTFHGNAHEIAHQWWGGMVSGAFARGHGFLSESLANYSAMMVTEKTYGVEAVRRTYDFQMNRYLVRRADFPDVPVLEVSNQPPIAYGKGAVALYLLRTHIGEDAMNRALRSYFAKFANSRLHPTSLDLFAELRAVTPDSLRYLLKDLFETVTSWDVRTTRAVVEPAAGDSGYIVTLEVTARKVRSDTVGNGQEVPMDDLVDVAVFAADSAEGRFGEVLYLQRHRIRSGAQTIRVTVPRQPARAGVDPYRMLIDRNRDDNVVQVKVTRTERPPTG